MKYPVLIFVSVRHIYCKYLVLELRTSPYKSRCMRWSPDLPPPEVDPVWSGVSKGTSFAPSNPPPQKYLCNLPTSWFRLQRAPITLEDLHRTYQPIASHLIHHIAPPPENDPWIHFYYLTSFHLSVAMARGSMHSTHSSNARTMHPFPFKLLCIR